MPLRKQRCTIVDQHTRGGFLSPTVWHVLFGAQTPKTPNKHCRVRILRHKPELVEEDILDSARHSCYGGSPNDLLRRSKNSSIPARHGKTTVISDLICSSLCDDLAADGLLDTVPMQCGGLTRMSCSSRSVCMPDTAKQQ